MVLSSDILQREFANPLGITLAHPVDGDDLAGDYRGERVGSVRESEFNQDSVIRRRHSRFQVVTQELAKVPAGRDHATKFHKLMLGVLEYAVWRRVWIQ